MDLKEKIKQIESKKTIHNFKIAHLVGFFVLGFIGLQFIALVVQILLGSPIDSIISKSFIESFVEAFGEEKAYLYAGFIDAVLMFSYYFVIFFIFCFLIVINIDILRYIKNCINKQAFIDGVKFAFIAFGLSFAYGIILNIFHSSGETSNNQQSIQFVFEASPFLTFFAIAIFAPVVEELTYRLGLFSLAAKKSKILAYAITILVFALIHFDFTADDIVNELWNLPSYMIGAACLSYAYSSKGNIVTSITAHSIYNTITYVFMILATFMN